MSKVSATYSVYWQRKFVKKKIIIQLSEFAFKYNTII
jgi:hypothetical protein